MSSQPGRPSPKIPVPRPQSKLATWTRDAPNAPTRCVPSIRDCSTSRLCLPCCSAPQNTSRLPSQPVFFTINTFCCCPGRPLVFGPLITSLHVTHHNFHRPAALPNTFIRVGTTSILPKHSNRACCARHNLSLIQRGREPNSSPVQKLSQSEHTLLPRSPTFFQLFFFISTR